jgi:hypothetical protein
MGVRAWGNGPHPHLWADGKSTRRRVKRAFDPNPFGRPSGTSGMDLTDPIFLSIAVGLGLLFFMGYLLLRRTVLGFREGFEGER